MQIGKNELVAGVPAKRLRDTLRRMDNFEWSPTTLAQELGLERTEAASVLATLAAEKYIERADWPKGRFRIGPAAPRLLSVRFIRRIDRVKADALVAGLIERAKDINGDKRYVQSVAELQVFGSYADPDKTDLGDVDIAYRLDVKPRHRDRDITDLSRLTKRSFPEIRPRNYLMYLFLPERVVLRTLKNRSPYISLHSVDDLAKIGVTGKTVFTHDRR